MKPRFFFFIILVAFSTGMVSAQKKDNKIVITGTLTNADDKPVIDALILIDNKKTAFKTDDKGHFRIKIKPDATRIGFVSLYDGVLEEDINGRRVINSGYRAKPILPPVASDNNERRDVGLRGKSVPDGDVVVDLGYAKLKKRYVSENIDVVDVTKKKYQSFHSLADLIQREIAGAVVTRNGVILGGSANMAGSVCAIIMVDGVENQDAIFTIPVTWVKSISVLKGSAAAIYGTRGFGGVIIITTRNFDNKK